MEETTTAAGLKMTLAPATTADHRELRVEFGRIVDSGEGFPQEPPLTDDEFIEVWVEDKSAVIVARIDGELVGAYYLKPNFPGRGAHIVNAGYFVVSEWRGKGIGEALVRHSFVQARHLGFDAMQYNLVFEDNPARALYERLGMQVAGRIPEAIDGRDAIVYWRKL